jgi:hypothetical protein
LLAVSSASAPASPEERPSGAGAVVAAVFPGVIAHGAGHFAGGNRGAAYRLLALEGLGLGGAVGGLAVLAATGASRRIAGPAAALTITGVALFAISGLADLYGVLAPAADRGQPLTTPPVMVSELGYRYVYDPVFRYRNFVFESIDARLGALRLSPSAWFALDDPNAMLRGVGALRLYGPGAGGEARDGSFVEVEAALTYHTFRSEGFRVWTGEASGLGRLDMARFERSLRGSFAELGVGWAMAGIGYDGLSFAQSGDPSEMLLYRFAYGVYLGAPGRGEARLYYDHRHDSFAAGLKVKGLGSGVAGHFGLDTSYFWGPSWGARLDAQIGSALVAGLSLLYRHGAVP